MSRIDASSTAIGGFIQLYKYEPFSNSFSLNSNAPSGDTLSFAGSSPELISFLTNPTARDVSFSSVNGPNTSYSANLELILRDLSGTLVMETLSNAVRIGAGRFLTPPTGTSYAFYKNEPLSVTFPAGLSFVGSIPIAQPIPSRTLPIGISWQSNSPTTYSLVGTPTIQSPNANYNMLGQGTSGRTISTNVNLAVNPERMLVDVEGSTDVSGLTIGTPMAPVLVSIRAPSYSPSSTLKFRYTYTALPSGFSFTDSNGLPFSSGSVTLDASSSIRLNGTLTSNAVRSFGGVPFTTTLTATRTFSPFLTSNVTFTFTPAELVLFDVPNVSSNFYVGIPLTASAFSNSFKARTLFPVVDSSIVSIFSPDLLSDLSLTFLSNLQRADLVGTPTSVGSGTFTVRAINGSAVGADISVPYSVVTDTLSFDFNVTPTTDVCYSFIISRDLSNSKTGYYTGSRTFRATAASGCNVTMTATPLSGTGLALTSVGANTYQLTGVPTTVTPLTTLTVTANAAATGATANTTISFSIVPDVFTFNDVSLTFVQNIAMTPKLFTATTLSERPVVQFSSANLPTGLTLTNGGVLSGTLLTNNTSGSFTVTASTGFASGSKVYSYTSTPDSVLLFTESNAYTYNAGASVTIPVIGVAYSGTTVSNYQFSNFNPTLGLSIGSTTGIIGGTLTDGVPPNELLPISSNFKVKAFAGTLDASLGATLATTNPIVNRWLMLRGKDPDQMDSETFSNAVAVLSADSTLTQWSSNNVNIQIEGSNLALLPGLIPTDFVQKSTDIDNNVRIATIVPRNRGVQSDSAQYLRGTSNGNVFPLETTSAIAAGSSLAHKPGTSTWWMAGVRRARDIEIAVYNRNITLVKSTDDGVTWSDAVDISSGGYPVYTRDWFYGVYSGEFSSYYGTLGTTVQYKDGVLLVGGANYLASAVDDATVYTALRSTDEGSTWSLCTGLSDSAVELATFNTDGSRWIATGSQRYSSVDFGSTYATDATTMWYSDDSGSTWASVNGGFNFIGYDVVYGSNTWVATGLDVSGGSDYIPHVRMSTNGSDWIEIDQLNNELYSNRSPNNKMYPPIDVGPILFDGSWNVFVFRTFDGTLRTPYVYTHGPSNLNDGNWTVSPVSQGIATYELSNPIPYVRLLPRSYMRTGSPTTTTFSFPLTTAGGPTITAPTTRSFLFYQYMPITPIVFSATGTGTVYFFVDSNALPQGLSWDPLTRTLSGHSSRLGDRTFTVYAKDDIAITPITIQTTTVIPRIIRQQDGAGAYTSLVRQYTLVNAAQNARDNRVFPTQERNLGAFAAPPAPDSVTPSNCECK